MVELLTMRLSGTGGMTVIEPGRVLAAWHSVTGDSLVDESTAALAKFAGQVGAGRIVCGSVTGSADHLVLAAWIVDVTDGHTEAQATVEGPSDSLAFLVDRLSARLLALAAGVEGHRLMSLEAAPLPAIRALGRSAFLVRGRCWAPAHRRPWTSELDLHDPPQRSDQPAGIAVVNATAQQSSAGIVHVPPLSCGAPRSGRHNAEVARAVFSPGPRPCNPD